MINISDADLACVSAGSGVNKINCRCIMRVGSEEQVQLEYKMPSRDLCWRVCCLGDNADIVDLQSPSFHDYYDCEDIRYAMRVKIS